MPQGIPAKDTFIGGTLGGFLIVNIDKVSIPDMTFIGLSEPGNAGTDTTWKIILIDKTTSTTRIRFSGGNSNFDKAWDSRLLYAYS